jgi:hypothetical protein
MTARNVEEITAYLERAQQSVQAAQDLLDAVSPTCHARRQSGHWRQQRILSMLSAACFGDTDATIREEVIGMLDPDRITEFARRSAAAQDKDARAAIQQEFTAYAADFLAQFSDHYHDFTPREDGNIQCTMDGYIRRRDRTAYIVDTRSGFIRPVDKDAQRGSRYRPAAPGAHL